MDYSKIRNTSESPTVLEVFQNVVPTTKPLCLAAVSVYINNTCFPLLAFNRTEYTFGTSSSIATTQRWRISKS